MVIGADAIADQRRPLPHLRGADDRQGALLGVRRPGAAGARQHHEHRRHRPPDRRPRPGRRAGRRRRRGDFDTARKAAPCWSPARSAAGARTTTASWGTATRPGSAMASASRSRSPATSIPAASCSARRPTSPWRSRPTRPTTTAGTATTVTVTASNGGPDPTGPLAITAPAPAGTSVGQSTPSVGEYDKATGNWTLPALASGASATLALVINTPAAGTRNATAEVASADAGDADSIPGNGVATEDDYATATITTNEAPVRRRRQHAGRRRHAPAAAARRRRHARPAGAEPRARRCASTPASRCATRCSGPTRG